MEQDARQTPVLVAGVPVTLFGEDQVSPEIDAGESEGEGKGKGRKKKEYIPGERTFVLSFSARISQTPEEVELYRSRMATTTAPANHLLRYFLYGYQNDPDCSLYDELQLGERMSEAEFRAGTRLLRSGFCSEKLPPPEDDAERPRRSKEPQKDADEEGGKMRSRGLAAPMLGDSQVLPSAGPAASFLAKLRQLGVLPLKTDLSASERSLLMEEVTRRLKSWVACDLRTRAAFRDQVTKTAWLLQSGIPPLIADPTGEGADQKTEDRWYELLRAYLRCNRMRAWAQTPTFSADRPPAYLLGDNYVPFALRLEGNRLHLMVQRGLLKGEYTADFGGGNKRLQLKDLVVEKLPGKLTVYRFSFTANGTRKMVMFLREPRIQFQFRKNGPALYLTMPLTATVVYSPLLVPHPKTGASRFMRRWPQKIEDLDKVTDLRALGIDLGINRLFAWAVLRAEAFREGLPTAIEVLDTGFLANGPCRAAYDELEAQFHRLRILMHRTATHAGVNWNTASAKQAEKMRLREEEIALVTDDVVGYLQHVDTLPTDRALWKRPGVWRCGGYLRELLRRFNELKAARFNHGARSLNDDIAWLGLIDQMIRCQQRFMQLGRAPQDKRPNELERYHRERRNTSRDLRRKLCRAIIDKAVQNRCAIIVFEDLLRSLNASAKENRLWNLWAPAMLLMELRSMAVSFCIAVTTVDPSFTSKMVYGQEQLGLRQRWRRSELFYLDKDEDVLRKTDADVNAAKNIARLALTRHAELWYFDAEKLEAPVKPAPVLGEKEEDWNARLQAHKRRCEERQRLIQRLALRLGADWKKKLGDNPTGRYLWHNGRFLNENERRVIEQEILDRVQDSGVFERKKGKRTAATGGTRRPAMAAAYLPTELPA